MKPYCRSFVTLTVAAAALGVPLGASPDDQAPTAEQVSAPSTASPTNPEAQREATLEPEVVPANTTSAVRAATPPPASRVAEPSPAQPVPTAPASRTRLSLPLEIEVHGRLYMGVAADERDDWTRRLDMDSARIGIEARLPGVLTVLEADLAERTPITDAFARLDGPLDTRFKAGRFKAPFSARQLESSWKLPLVDRGLVNDYLVKDNDLGGRRLGATAGVRPWNGRFEAYAGIFVGERTAFGGENQAQDFSASVSVRPWMPLELGATAYRAGSSDPLVAVHQAASLYARLVAGALDASLEGFAGKVAAGDVTAGTALAGWTFALGETRRLKVTPVAGGEVLEVRGATRGVGHSAIAGAVLSWTKGLKVKLQGERARRPGDDVSQNAMALQIATRF